MHSCVKAADSFLSPFVRQGERGHGRSKFHSDWRSRLLHAGWYVILDVESEAPVRIIHGKPFNYDKEKPDSVPAGESVTTCDSLAWEAIRSTQQRNMIQFRAV